MDLFGGRGLLHIPSEAMGRKRESSVCAENRDGSCQQVGGIYSSGAGRGHLGVKGDSPKLSLGPRLHLEVCKRREV